MTPEGWQMHHLGDLCSQVSVRAASEDLPVLSVSKDLGIVLQSEKFKRRVASDDISNYKRVRFGQFVYDPMLLWAGNIGRQRRVPEGVVSPAYTAFETNGRVSDEFFERFLKWPRLLADYKNISRGTNVRRQKALFSDFAGLAYALPPLPEQRKIAAILSSMEEAIEATQEVIDQLGIVKKAMMAELLTRGLPGRHAKFKQTEIGEIPDNWDTTTYGELAADVPAAIQSGPFGSELKHSEFQSEGALVIGIDNVRDGEFSIGNGNRISASKFNDLRRFQARPLDLLITVMATVGRCCVVPEDIEPSIITKHVYRLSVDRHRADPYFLMYCLYGIRRLADVTVHGPLGDVRSLPG